MFKTLISALEKQEKTLLPPTKICKICFKEISDFSLNSLVKPHYFLCFDCYKTLIPIFNKFKVDGVEAMNIYNYDDTLRSMIYQFKGCYDYELKDTFLDRYRSELRLYYYDYVVVPVPSFIDDDKKRGFNHVFEIFKTLNLPIDRRIEKTVKVKQSDRNSEERKNIGDFLKLTNEESMCGKNVLIVDDIFTTGSTIRSCIKLIKKLNPKKIKVLVICKTLEKPHMVSTNTN